MRTQIIAEGKGKGLRVKNDCTRVAILAQYSTC